VIGGNIIFGQEVNSITFDNTKKCWKINSKSAKSSFEYFANDLIYTAPPQSLLKNLKEPLKKKPRYKSRIKNLPQPSGALVFYSALRIEHLKNISSNHYQFVSNELGSLFVSISENGDGRAPKGEVTLIASLFTKTEDWIGLDKEKYIAKKEEYLKKI